tara:strand:- start:95 stop:436 length:342 start_codon:yes stop_codon:yes gene_type:complete
MTKKHVYLTLPSNEYRDLVIRANYKDMEKVNKLLDLLTKVDFTLVNTDTYMDSQRFDLSKMEIIEEQRVVWDKQLEWGVQSRHSYNYGAWVEAGCPLTVEEVSDQEEAEPCAN